MKKCVKKKKVKLLHNQLVKNKTTYLFVIFLCVFKTVLLSQKTTYSFIKPSQIISKVDTVTKFWIIDKSKIIITDKDTLYKFTFSEDSTFISGYIKFNKNEILFLNVNYPLNDSKIQRIKINFNKVVKSENIFGEGPLLKYKTYKSLNSTSKIYTTIEFCRDKNLIISHVPFISHMVFTEKFEYPIELIFIVDGKKYNTYPNTPPK